jgi:hypothetical protein
LHATVHGCCEEESIRHSWLCHSSIALQLRPQGNCSSNTAGEPFYDYSGALRCLMADSGDVAFTRAEVLLVRHCCTGFAAYLHPAYNHT